MVRQVIEGVLLVKQRIQPLPRLPQVVDCLLFLSGQRVPRAIAKLVLHLPESRYDGLEPVDVTHGRLKVRGPQLWLWKRRGREDLIRSCRQ